MYRIQWRKVVALVLMSMLVLQSYAYAASLGNIRYVFTDDRQMIVYYNLSGKRTYTISVMISLDSGKTFSIIPLTVSGDVGKGVAPGGNKYIQWDVFKDVKQLSGDMVIKLIALQEPGKPINKWYVFAGAVLTGGAFALISASSTNKSVGTPPTVIGDGTLSIKAVFPE